ncbi:hypothetical protein [Azohydromonas caseinilytica]|uniref:Uncharacterized protein n=1 Tax=Azohydromonas caseinilytica TaxID=2728836 RepID=A0A848F8B0_9BURK|nr:hypothetical protein [Azohydromonas caseinilytica]NML15592.1 hypothetical protein [Azohydromonas caseinilytica]
MSHPAVYRQLAIPVPVFDRIKDVQRRHEAQHGQRLTLAAVVSRIVLEHQRHEEQELQRRADRSR